MRRFPRPGASRITPPYKLLSILLQYPDETILQAEEELASAVAELPPSPQSTSIEQFWMHWTGMVPVERAQRYVETFDLQKRSSLYLTFYMDGDKRQRGTTLLRLKRLYAAGGMVLDHGELPDFLPVMLEFGAFAPDGYGETLLNEFRAAIEVVRTRLYELKSPYALLLDAVCVGLPSLSIPEMDRVRRLIVEGPPHELVGLEPFAPPEVMPLTEIRR